jgi:hypothetical protein
LVEVFHLDLDAEGMRRSQACAAHCFLYGPGGRDVVVLDKDAVGQAEPVIFPASVPHGLFFQASPQWGCLSGVQQLTPGPDGSVGHFSRKGGYPAQPLGEIEGGPLTGQKGSHSALQPERGNVGFNFIAVIEQAFYPDLGVEKFEDSSEWYRAGQNEGLSPKDNGASLLLGGNNREGRRVSAPDVFEKGKAEQIVEVR